LSESKKVVICFEMFLPYHVARIRAAQRCLSPLGYCVVGVELVSSSRIYNWAPVQGDCGFQRVTLFEGLSYPELRRGAIIGRTWGVLEKEQPSVVVFGWQFPEMLGLLAWCQIRRRPAIAMSESKLDDMPRYWWKEWVKRWFIRRFSAALVGGAPQLEYAVALGIPYARCFLGYDVVDNDYFAHEADSARLRAEQLRATLKLPSHYFMTAARFIEEKNLPRAIQAYAAYRERVGPSAWKWVVCGDGPLRADVGRAVRMFASEDWILLPGLKQYDEIPLYYGLASAFWLPSQKDGWGLVVNEAMASGLPVLVSRRCGCAPDLVREEENGWTFDPYNVSDMADALTRMHEASEDQRRAMGNTSRRIIADWGPERFGQGLLGAVSAALAS